MAFPWHRVFHPLCGADPVTLARLVARHGAPSPRGALPLLVAGLTSLARLPFTALELALDALPAAPQAPVFIVGFPRSGTTHLHNLMAATGAFATVGPVRAALPWEPRTLGPLLKPFVDPYLPATRLIDGVAMGADAPTEDEVGLANLAPGSYFHAVYFPRRFAQHYRAGLLAPAREGALRRYVRAVGRGRPLLLKNPAYTAQVPDLLRLFPGARVVHIHRDPQAVLASSRRALARALDELALQAWEPAEIDRAILDTYPAVMRRLREGTAGLPASRFAEVSFEAVHADPRAVLHGLWDQLGLPAPDWGGVEAHLAAVRNFRPEGARPSPADRALLADRWPEEVALYGVSAAAGR